MFNNRRILLPLLLGCLGLMGCKAGQLFQAQEWSENYALMPGTTCTSPAMIDGNVNTVGEAGREIMITLPERRSIHRIVLRNINFKDFVIYQSRVGEGNWQKIRVVENNRLRDLDLRVTATTESVRFRIGGTLEDQRAASRIDSFTGRVTPQRKRAPRRAGEIELYGFKETSMADGTAGSVRSEPAKSEEEPLPEVDIDDEPLF